MLLLSRHFLCFCTALLLAVLGSGAAQAKEMPVQACVAPLLPGVAIADLMVRPEAFDCAEDQTRHGPGDFLVELRFPPMAAKRGDPLVLRMASVWQDRGSILFHYADGATERLDFTPRNISRFMTVGSVLQFPVPLRDAPLKTAYVQVHDATNVLGVVLNPRIMTLSDSHVIELIFAASYAAFVALALTLVIYNLSLWTALRHRFQLFYCAMLTAFAAYTLFVSGAFSLQVPSFDNNDRMRIVIVLLAIAQVSTLQFIRHFFESIVFGPVLLLLTRVTSAAAIATALAFAVLAPWNIHLLLKLYFTAMTGIFCLAPVILVRAWRVGSKYFGLFLLAWCAPLAIAMLRVAYAFGLIEYSLWIVNANLCAVAIEALLSALMVTARVRELSLERDDAMASEQVALRLANTDPLTGLLNRRAFMDLALGRASLHRLLLIDIDHFKRVNDRLGHEVGDQVLSAVAHAIQGCRPARSLAVRLGGEEFGILLPRASFDSCPAEMILETVRGAPMPRDVVVTVSIGFADGSVATDKDWKRLYRFADSALYRAKSDGRDRACRATDFSVAA